MGSELQGQGILVSRTCDEKFEELFAQHQLRAIQHALSLANINYGLYCTACSQFSKHQLRVIQHALSLANINYGLYIMLSV